MFELWVPITIAAAFCQNVRSALQKHLKGQMGTSGATMTRFIYAIPFAALYAFLLHSQGGYAWPAPTATFAIYTMTGGLTQIAATALLVYLFSFRNFAVGTTFSKTETVQAAIFGAVVLGDPLSLGALLAILVSLLGVVALTVARDTNTTLRSVMTSWTGKPALIGLASGACFGISAVSYRAASLSLGGEGFLMQAAFTLACVTIFQTLVMTAYLLVREPNELVRVLKSWRISVWVGLSGMAASAGWFTAMTIQNAAYVRALGQIELLFTFAVSVILFKEKPNLKEISGILLVCGGILILLLYA
ncbi:MAG: EamA family transporter [Rhodospirillales bacterium]|nr:EamA family transporter [Rhodospirillales bacterium]